MMDKGTDVRQQVRELHQQKIVNRCATCELPATNGQHCSTCQPIALAVLQGVRLLDEREGGWANSPRLNLRKLDMEWHGHCILCLLFGSYRSGIERLDLGPLLIVGSVHWDSYGWEHGFTLPPLTPPEERRAAFARLTTAWKQVIVEARQAEAMAGVEQRDPK
jgi:hypothetical protein